MSEDANKKGEISEPTTIFKLKDGTWKWLCFGNEIRTFRDYIEAAQKSFQGQYAGAHDFYRFKLGDGRIIEIISKFSHEEVWKMWTERGGKTGSDGHVGWGLKFKRNDEEGNKCVMIGSMLLTFKEDKKLGTGDSELDKNLAHDFILTSLARLSANVKQGSKKKYEGLMAIKRQIEHYDLPGIEADRLKIIDAISGNHILKQRSKIRKGTDGRP